MLLRRRVIRNHPHGVIAGTVRDGLALPAERRRARGLTE